MADWDTVREIAARASRAPRSPRPTDKPAFKVKGKLFAWVSPDDAAEDALALRVDPGEQPLLLETAPDRYFQTPHYHGHPILLVRMEQIERQELGERIEDSWLLRAPKRLVDAFVAAGD